MKHLATTLILATAFCGASFAQHTMAPVKAKGKGPSIHCAVLTHSTVNIAEATRHHMFADYKGNRYFFCCADCPRDFKKNPAKYAKHSHIKTPKKQH
jgi:YHS domain-containing protein